MSLSRRDLTIPLLAVAGGSVDAIGLFGLGVLTAAQTGNTIRAAVSLAQGHSYDLLFSATSLVAYVAGAALGALLLGRAKDGDGNDHADKTRVARHTLFVEAMLIAALLAAWLLSDRQPEGGLRAAFIVAAGLAMGMQSAAVLALHVRPATTYITGTLTTFTTELVAGTSAGHDAAGGVKPSAERLPAGPAAPRRQSVFSMDQPWVYGAVWFVYAIGAVIGALLFRWVGAVALVLPLAAVCGALVG